MTGEEINQLLTQVFRDHGFNPDAGAGFAGIVAELADLQARDAVVELVGRLRETVFGESLWRELAGDDPHESAESAARRLHVAPSVLRRTRARIRVLLSQPSQSQPCPPTC